MHYIKLDLGISNTFRQAFLQAQLNDFLAKYQDRPCLKEKRLYITSLKLSGQIITEDIMQKLLNHFDFTKLKSLDLSYADISGINISELTAAKSFQSLIISHATINKLEQNKPFSYFKAKRLNIEGFRCIDYRKTQQEAKLANPANNNNSVEDLVISYMTFAGYLTDPYNLGDFLKYIGPSLKKLIIPEKEYYGQNNSTLTEFYIDTIIKYNIGITELHLIEFNEVLSPTIEKLLSNSSVKFLKLSNCKGLTKADKVLLEKKYPDVKFDFNFNFGREQSQQCIVM